MSQPPTANDPLTRLITQPAAELGRLARLVRFQVSLWRFCARRLQQNNLMAMSAALSFRTIFALIPLLVLILLVASAVGVLEDSKASLHSFLVTSGMAEISAFGEAELPAAGAAASAPMAERKYVNLAEQIESIVAQVQSKLSFRSIGPIGAALFIWTALTLLMTMEDSLNRVFSAPRSRSVPRRVLLYWSAMTLGPVVLAVAIYAGQRAAAVFQYAPHLSWLLIAIGWTGPVLVGVLVLAAVYVLLPNTVVNYRTALGGALVAVVIWMVAKWAFSIYVQRFVVSGNLYGILGVLPLFLLWLNFNWMIFLFGAELAHTAANLRWMEATDPAESGFFSPSDALVVTLAVARAYAAGKGPLAFDQISAQTLLPTEATRWLLGRLVAQGVVCSVRGGWQGAYILAKPPAGLLVRDILENNDGRSAGGWQPGDQPDATGLVAQVRGRMLGAIDELTVADLLTDAAPLR